MISKCLVRSLVTVPIILGFTVTASADDIVHDAEYYILDAQNGEKWAVEDNLSNLLG